MIEAPELPECFQWDNDRFDEPHVKEELADVMVYCQNLADKLGIDPDKIINKKMEQNEAKYPVGKLKEIVVNTMNYSVYIFRRENDYDSLLAYLLDE